MEFEHSSKEKALSSFEKLVIAGVAVFGLFQFYKWYTAEKDIFVSYHHKDMKYKNMLLAWASNEKFPLSFIDSSTDLTVRSKDRGVVRRVVSEKIGKADYFLCLIGDDTHASDWVQWEIEKAKEKGKPLIAVKVKKGCISPKAILNSGAEWAHSFKFSSIRKAIEK